ncbi:acyltransferase family protein [Catenovulum sp. SM1970]|uniref:acyltransferase family protein n=1 Tax=Marinifaba aquimaris TaxID=2741323 RepID=UPI0015724A6F|nr:acyltransferase family protein [Marinifaba aquimaris]NTS76289.1 acyltransferase family protein [Marinifaba aquimaris]
MDNSRYHYMDNLRALAMFAGVIFHLGLAYSPLMHNLWLVADPVKASWIDPFLFWLHTFRMPLFFLIAGFFAALLIDKKGLSGFLKNRAVRLALPFVLFLPLVYVCFFYVFKIGINDIENIPPFMQLAKTGQLPNDKATTAHLWFIYNLLMFCAGYALLVRLGVFTWLNKTLDLTETSYQIILIVLLPLAVIPALYSQIAPFPAPEFIQPELWSFGFYGLIFLAGALIYQNPQLINTLYHWRWYLLLTAVAAYSLFYLRIPSHISLAEIREMVINGPDIPTGKEQLITVTLQAFASIYFTLYSLVFGYQLLNKQSEWSRYLADSSYWVYIIHVPLLAFIQLYLIDSNAPIAVKFLIALVSVFGLSLISYSLLIRPTWFGRMLNGKRQPPIVESTNTNLPAN